MSYLWLADDQHPPEYGLEAFGSPEFEDEQEADEYECPKCLTMHEAPGVCWRCRL